MAIVGAPGSAASLRRIRAMYTSRVLSWTIAPWGQAVRISSRRAEHPAGPGGQRGQQPELRRSQGLRAAASLRPCAAEGSRQRARVRHGRQLARRLSRAWSRATTSSMSNGLVT